MHLFWSEPWLKFQPYWQFRRKQFQLDSRSYMQRQMSRGERASGLEGLPFAWSGNIKSSTHANFLGAKRGFTEYREEHKTQLVQQPTFCGPPGRKHGANNETSPAPRLTMRPWDLFPNLPQQNRRRGKKSSSDACRDQVWGVFLNSGLWNCFAPLEWRCGHLNKAGKKNK